MCSQPYKNVFSRVCSKLARVPVSLWGSGGGECVRWTLRLRPQPFATVRNRSQPSATVRNRSREGRMAVPMVFLHRVASFCVAGVALREIQTCFVTCRKWFCLAGAILLRRFQKMSFSFRGRRSTLDLTVFIMRGRHSTLEESRFCESHCQGCVQW